MPTTERAQRYLGIEIPLQRIPSLDGLRAVSIALVLWSHTPGPGGFWAGRDLHWMGDLGVLGVRIFFIISGFLITTLLLTEHRRTGGISLKMFYFRRTMRIFPACYFFVLMIAAAGALSVTAVSPRDLLHAVTYTMNFVAEPGWILGHLWSLAVEEQFYLLWPATLALVGIRRGLQVAVGVVLVSPLVRFACMYIPAADPLIGIAFPTIADPLAVGCLLAGMRDRLDNNPRYLAFLESWKFWLLPLAIVVLNAPLPGTKLRMLVTQSLLNICIAVVIDYCVRFHQGRVGRALNWAPLRCMGVLSYSLYLWQQPFSDPFSHARFNGFPINLMAGVLCAYVSYRLVEKPCLDLRASLERKWKNRPAQSPSPSNRLNSLRSSLPCAGSASANSMNAAK